MMTMTMTMMMIIMIIQYLHTDGTPRVAWSTVSQSVTQSSDPSVNRTINFYFMR